MTARFQAAKNMSDWSLRYNDWDPQQQPLREALCTLGNGLIATRGAFEENNASDTHYPGTYLAGGYNRLESEVEGRIIENEDLVNWPNWLYLTFKIEGGDWFNIETVTVLQFEQTLNFKEGLLKRDMLIQDQQGRKTRIVSERLVHMGSPHLAAIHWQFIPVNWNGAVTFRSALDGQVSNKGVKRYRALKGQHLKTLSTEEVGEDGICLHVETVQSRISMAQAARTEVCVNGERIPAKRETLYAENWIGQDINVQCQKQKSLCLEKIVTIYNSQDDAISEPMVQAKKEINRVEPYEALRASHIKSWKRLWDDFDLTIGPDQDIQGLLRFHIFHLLQTTSLNSIGADAGVPARGLHGEAYRGHIFWDELFIFPILNLRLPELTRHLLLYRYNRLDEARAAAKKEGFRGAMFPWQSGSDGREETQVMHLNPLSHRWLPDDTHRQRHINAAIAFNIWQYFQTTEDRQFLSFYGAEMFLEIARFWGSLVQYNQERQRYEIHGVVGPDEFHTESPDSEEPGLKNNTYTNVMAAWVLWRAQSVLNHLTDHRQKQVRERLHLTDGELLHWDQVSRKMYVHFNENQIPLQFEGYENLQNFDWEEYRMKHTDIQRLDRILEAEGKNPNHYQAGKQADVLMLFYLFSCEELSRLFQHLDYDFNPEEIPNIIDFYLQRTSHGSTLSRVTASWVLARSQREQSWEFFENALLSDISDIQGGTTSEGIHLGAMAGTVDMIQRGYTGVEVRDDVLWFDPCLPNQLDHLDFNMRFRGVWLRLKINHYKMEVQVQKGWSHSIRVGFKGKTFRLTEGDTKKFLLKQRRPTDCPRPLSVMDHL